jgi:predicted Zn-dependent peptidase
MAGGMNHLLRLPGMSLFFAAFTPDVPVGRIEHALNAQIGAVLTDGVSEEELEKVRNTALAHRCFEMYSIESICQRLGHAESIEGDHRLWVERLKSLENLDSEQLIEAARRYWTEENRHTLYLRPRKVSPLLYGLGFVRRFLPGR